jgi:hypothetical protein
VRGNRRGADYRAGEDEKIWGSMVKQTLKRRKPGFSESYYGYRSFGELLEDAMKHRLLVLERDEKSGPAHHPPACRRLSLVSGIPEIRPGQSIELLKELHILTRDGQAQPGQPAQAEAGLSPVPVHRAAAGGSHAEAGELTLVDHGAGKSYLGFILYDLFLKTANEGRVFGIETRAELVDKSRALAQSAWLRAHVLPRPDGGRGHRRGAVAAKVDVVTALHACDTATDDAIRFALQRQARSSCWRRAARPRWQAFCAAQERVAGGQCAGGGLAPSDPHP